MSSKKIRKNEVERRRKKEKKRKEDTLQALKICAVRAKQLAFVVADAVHMKGLIEESGRDWNQICWRRAFCQLLNLCQILLVKFPEKRPDKEQE